MENGTDFRSTADTRLVDRLRKEHALEPDIPVFLFVGRMMWYKETSLLLMP